MNAGRATLLAVACATAALGWWLSRPEPAPPAPPIERVLASSRAFSMEPGLQLAPRFSPDARLVAFALAEGDDSRIVVQAVDRSSRRFIGEAEGVRVSPVFFPDGQRIAYWQAAEGGCGIFERTLATGAERRLLDCAMLPRVRFDISPDGTTLVFTGSATPDSHAGLWLLPLAGGAPRALTTPPAEAGDDLHPRFSPDGREIAFFRGREGLRQPWIVPADGNGQPRPAGRECGRCFGLAWNRDRRELVVAGDWFGQPGLRAVDAETGEARRLGASNARFPDVSARGDIVYEVARDGARREPDARPRIEEAANAPVADGPAQIDLMLARR